MRNNKIKVVALRGVALICLVLVGTLILGGCKKKKLKPTEGVEYEVAVDRSHAVVIGYEGDARDVVIADEYHGVPVERIESLPGEDIVSVSIPDSVEIICEGAFSECPSLESIVIPDSVKKIGNGAFKYCFALKGAVIGDGVTELGTAVFAFCNSLESATVGKGIISLSDDTFAWCSSLESVSLPDRLLRIGNSAFYNCIALDSFTVPDGATSIGDSAFEWCTGLRSIVIPESMVIIGDMAFQNCAALSEVYYKGTVEEWSSISNSLLIYLSDGVEVQCNYSSEE